MLHAIYNYVEEEYADATFNVEYYVNVSDIIRDENTGYVKEIIGEKVDRQTYEKKVRRVSGVESRLRLFLLAIMIRYTLMTIC